MMNNIKPLIFSAIGAFIGSAFGYFVFKGAPPIQNMGFQPPRQGIVAPGGPGRRALSGSVLEIGKDEIILETPIFNPKEPMAPPITGKVKVGIDSKTEIVKFAARDHKDVEKEFAKYQKSGGAMPVPFEEKKMKFQDIKKGDRLSAQATESIEGKDSFVASKIMMEQDRPTMIPPGQTAGGQVPPPPIMPPGHKPPPPNK